MGAYDTYTEPCPYCGVDCDADWCDVGVGLVQCGPFHCFGCKASEIGPYDKYFNPYRPNGSKPHPEPDDRILTKRESDTGWYEPHTSPGSSANVINGQVVGHEVMKSAYQLKFENNELWNDKEYVDDWWESIQNVR